MNDTSALPTAESSQTTRAARVVAETNGLRIVVEADDESLLDQTVPWLPEGWIAGAAAEPCDRRYRLTVERSAHEVGLLQYAFSIDGEHRFRSPDIGIFSDYFENDLHHYIATYTRGHIFVHAGVAVWNGRAIVIPGRSFAGKSTLTEALLQAGATYYSDDYAPIDERGLVHPFPRHLRLRNRQESGQNRVDPRLEGWPVGDDAVPVGIVAALRYDRDKGWDVQEVSRGAGVLALLGNTVAARERPVDAMGIMARAVENAIVLEGTRGEAADAAGRLLGLLDSLS